MVNLENIVPGMRLAGVIGYRSVEIVATRSYGPNSLEVVWRGPDGLGERIFDQSDEPRLPSISAGRSFVFDGDGHLFRLVSDSEPGPIAGIGATPSGRSTRSASFTRNGTRNRELATNAG